MSDQTSMYMTKYERAKVLGIRARQISMENSSTLTVEIDPIEIARKELEEGKINITIRRYLPDGTYKDWNVNELIQKN